MKNLNTLLEGLLDADFDVTTFDYDEMPEIEAPGKDGEVFIGWINHYNSLIILQRIIPTINKLREVANTISDDVGKTRITNNTISRAVDAAKTVIRNIPNELDIFKEIDETELKFFNRAFGVIKTINADSKFKKLVEPAYFMKNMWLEGRHIKRVGGKAYGALEWYFEYDTQARIDEKYEELKQFFSKNKFKFDGAQLEVLKSDEDAIIRIYITKL